MAIKTMLQPRVQNSDINAKQLFAGGPEDAFFQEASGQTYGISDFVFLNGSGQVAICGTTSSVINTRIAGLATAKATGVQATKTHFEVIREDTLISINVWSATPANAQLAITMLGLIVPIRLQSAIWVADLDTTAESGSNNFAKAKIVRFIDKIGDQFGRVLIKIIDQTQKTDGTAVVRNLQLA